jgi:hypothetical protein
MLKDASERTSAAESRVKTAEIAREEAERKAGFAHRRIAEIMRARKKLQKQYEGALYASSTAYRILTALQQQLSLERAEAVRVWPCPVLPSILQLTLPRCPRSACSKHYFAY